MDVCHSIFNTVEHPAGLLDLQIETTIKSPSWPTVVVVSRVPTMLVCRIALR
jgi:hypothetical protein